jgi:hypothetical protein
LIDLNRRWIEQPVIECLQCSIGRPRLLSILLPAGSARGATFAMPEFLGECCVPCGVVMKLAHRMIRAVVHRHEPIDQLAAGLRTA